MNENSSYFFNQMRAISDLSTIAAWNTSKVTNMSGMFSYAGNSATTWSVKIPRTNGAASPISNTTSRFYGKTTSYYATPLSGKSFTLAD